MQKPSYYAKLPIDPLKYAYDNNLNSYQFNALKYITRYKDKNGIEDLQKAIHCLEELKAIECPKNTNATNDMQVNFVIDPFEYAYKNKLNETETAIVVYITRYKGNKSLDYLNKAIRHLTDLIKIKEKQLVSQDTKQEEKPSQPQKDLEAIFKDFIPGMNLLHIANTLQAIKILHYKGTINPLKFSSYPFANKGYMFRIENTGLLGLSQQVTKGDIIVCKCDNSPKSPDVSNNWLHIPGHQIPDVFNNGGWMKIPRTFVI